MGQRAFELDISDRRQEETQCHRWERQSPPVTSWFLQSASCSSNGQKWQWILTTWASVSWASVQQARHGIINERLRHKTHRLRGRGKKGWGMSRREGNEFRGWGVFDMTGGSYLLAAASPLPTKGLSYFLWTETETPINPRGRAHLRHLLCT